MTPDRINTEEQLVALEKLLSEATEGPWAWDSTSQGDNDWSVGLMDPPVGGHIDLDRSPDTIVDLYVCEGRSHLFADAELIVAARNILPDLIAEIRYLRQQVDSYRLLSQPSKWTGPTTSWTKPNR